MKSSLLPTGILLLVAAKDWLTRADLRMTFELSRLYTSKFSHFHYLWLVNHFYHSHPWQRRSQFPI